MLANQIKMKQKNKNLDVCVLLGTLSASLLGNLLTGEGVKTKMSERGVIRASEEIINSSESF